MFVNQFGHAMDYAQAVSLASSMGYSEAVFEGFADNSDTDGGAQRSASLSVQNNFIFGHGPSPYGLQNGITGWPTTYDDTKGLNYYYPYIFFWANFMGPDETKVANGTLTQLDADTVSQNWIGRGTLGALPEQSAQGPLAYGWDFDAYGDYLKQPHVPANFNFGATSHGLTLYAEKTIAGFTWMPAERRHFFPAKTYSAYTTASGIDETEIRLRRYNYLTRGNSFTNWTFNNGATFLSSGHTGPNGVTTGSLSASLIGFSGSSDPSIQRVANLQDSGRTYTFSVFLQGITANTRVNVNFDSGIGSGIVTLGTGWNRFQIQKFIPSTGGFTATISGNTGGAGITWATQFRMWGAQVELAEILDSSSSSFNYYLDSGATIASEIVAPGSAFRSIWLARKGEYAEKELRNFLNYWKNAGFTMGSMSIDDEAFSATHYYNGSFNSRQKDYIWEYNTIKAENDPTGNTWYLSYAGISAQPKSMLRKTSRFGTTGVTNFRDLLILRGFTTNPSGTCYIGNINFGAFTNKDSVSANDVRSYASSLFRQCVFEMYSYFIEDGIVTPFKEIMLGNTADTTSLISNYGYLDSFAGFIGNTYLSGENTVQPSLQNIIVPNVAQELFKTTLSNATTNDVWKVLAYKDDTAYSNRQQAYNKCGNYSSISTYGTWQNSGAGYGYYLSDHILRPTSGAISIVSASNIGARNVFDFTRTALGNCYGYSGASWGMVPQAAYLLRVACPSPGFTYPGIARQKQVHVPPSWRGITIAGGVGNTFTCLLCDSSISATYTGVSAGFGVTGLGFNNQTSEMLDHFFYDLWGITQISDSMAGLNLIPESVQSAMYGMTQGAYSAQVLRGNTGALSSGGSISYAFDNCGHPIPGITFVPGTIYRDYETHWYPLGYFGFVTDLGAHRETARTRVFEALEARNRLGDPTISQDPYVIWVHTPSFATTSVTNTWSRTDFAYKNSAFSGYGYMRPLGITYDVTRWNYDGGNFVIRGNTLFYGDINHYWAENIRHAYLHKLALVDQWADPGTVCNINPGRTTQTANYNSAWTRSYWKVGSSPMVENPDEIKGILGNDSVFRVGNLDPNSGFSGFCGFTMGGACADMAYRLVGYRLNKILDELNTQGNGVVQETMYLAPVDWSNKEYQISGAQLTTGMYLWRITFLHKATQPIYVKGSRFGDLTGVKYNIAGVTNFIDNPNHEKGIWWACNMYELPIVTNPPLAPNNGLPPGTTTWNGLSAAGSSPQFPLGIANTSILF